MKLITLYQGIAIQAYGACIVLGLGIFYWFLIRDNRFVQSGFSHHFPRLLNLGIFMGIIGGRLGYYVTEPFEWQEFFCFWLGGYSILSAVISVIASLALYCYRYKLPIQYLDLCALYVPIWHACARLGCFFAGCCHGIPCNRAWAFTYSHEDSLAPLGIPLHPTQLYSALLFLIIFCVFYWYLKDKTMRPGSLVAFYLLSLSSERFIIDFWRADRSFFNAIPWISIYQFFAVFIAFGTLVWLSIAWIQTRHVDKYI